VKLLNLSRLRPANRVAELKYLAKRLLKRQVTPNEQTLNEYYFHLISNQGVQKAEDMDSYTAHYTQSGLTVRLRKRPSSDLNVFSQVFKYLEYEPLLDLVKELWPDLKNPVVLDAGANIGLFTLYLSKEFTSGRFFCIEPGGENYEALLQNLEMNHIPAVSVNAGLWSHNTKLKLVQDFRDQKDWSLRVEPTDDLCGIDAFSLDHLLHTNKLQQIDILKIDIEGSEKQIFTQPGASLEFLAKTRCMVIEIHDEFDCRQDIYNILAAENFEITEAGEMTLAVNRNFK
jgi:FkbM family methyltransferase